MFTSHQKPTGTTYTGVVASLVFAFVFSPAVLLVSGPLGYGSLPIGIALTASSLAVAWVSWKSCSQLTIPSIETLPVGPLIRPRH